MNIEEALRFVQSEKERMLESLRKNQMESVENGNREIWENSSKNDMLHFTSLISKRNETFDLMNNFMKKIQDSKNSIIRNMR